MKISIFASLKLANGNTAYAEGPSASSRGNWREICRQQIAGLFLNNFDSLTRSRQLAASLKEKQVKLETQLKLAQKQLEKAEKTATDDEFDVGKDEHLIRLRNIKDGLSSALAQTQLALKNALKDLSETEQANTEMNKSLDDVFIQTRIGNDAREGYPFRLEYRFPCPPYRYLCPLPPVQAKKLADIFGENTPDACRRYSQQ